MYFQINNAAYWYEVHGTGVPVVMLHGFTGSADTWRPFAANQEKQLQVIAIDLPGHGQTKAKVRSMEECLYHLHKLIECLHLESFHLLGYSMGGRTALSFALTYPEKIRSLILESASPGIADEEERHLRMEKDEQLADWLMENGVESFTNYWENLPLFQTQKNLPENVQQEIRDGRLRQSKKGLAQSLRSMGTGRQHSNWEYLHQVKEPVLLLVGGLDQKFIDKNKKMESNMPSSTLVVCENAGHVVHVEKSAEFDRIVTAFILENDPLLK